MIKIEFISFEPDLPPIRYFHVPIDNHMFLHRDLIGRLKDKRCLPMGSVVSAMYSGQALLIDH